LVIAGDRPMGFVAKEELFDVKNFDKLIEFYGAISINRSKPDKTTFKSVKKIFAAGWSVGMFVEGTRAKNPGVLGQPHLGAAFLAKSNKVPILPVGLVGTNLKHGKAHATIGNIIQTSDDLEKTTWEIMEALSKLTGFAMPETRKIASEID
jgi:1-acyl-sn-glycerol-3-phosphate acyltransferase